MSTIPGRTLEAFLMWEYDLIVDGDDGANESLRIAEIMGRETRRKNISGEQFAPIVALFEPHREAIERLLEEYDEYESGSWRDYASCVSDQAPDELYETGATLLPAAPDTDMGER